MGYTTWFNGAFKINKPVDDKTFRHLYNFNKTRRMKRDPAKLAKRLKLTKKEVIKRYGEECELYSDGEKSALKGVGDDVIDVNDSGMQPSLWCGWTIDDDKDHIIHDGGEKFYDYIEWLHFINERILKPNGYKLVEGDMYWDGEEDDDKGLISIENEEIVVKPAIIFYVKEEDVPRVTKIVENYLDEPMKELIDHKLDKM